MLVLNADLGVNLVQDGTVTSAKIVDGSIVIGDMATTATSIGVGQTWQNVTGREFNVAYTNTYGKPIMVSINVSSTVRSSFALYVNGQEICTTTEPNATEIVNLCAIVPAGMPYLVGIGTGVGTFNKWSELR